MNFTVARAPNATSPSRRRLTSLWRLRLLCVAIGGLVMSVIARAQRPPTRDSAAIARRLADARDSARIPLLNEMAAVSRDQPARVMQLTDEALALLTRFPSTRDEVRARLARAFALQVRGDYPPARMESEMALRLMTPLIAPNTDPSAADRELAADAWYHVGQVQWRMSEHAAGLASAQQARALLEPLGNTETQAKTLSLLGALHYSQSQFGEALEWYLASLRMSEAMRDDVAMGRAHNNIGLVLLALDRKDEAYAAMMRALDIHERRGTRQFLVNTLNNVGLVLLEMDRPREALPYLERALAFDRETGNRYGQAKEYSNIGGAWEKLGDLNKALGFHEQALAIREAIDDKEGRVITTGAIAEVRMRLGDPRRAIPLFERALALAAEINARTDEAYQLRLLSQARALVGDTAGAFRDFQRFHAITASLNDSTRRQQIAELEARYQSRAQQQDLARVSAIAESQRSKLQGAIGGAVLLAACLVLLIALTVWRGRAQQALRESEERYRALFQASALPTFLIDRTTQRLIDGNEPARAVIGVTSAEKIAVRDIEPEWVRRALIRALDARSTDTVVVDDAWTGAGGEPRRTEVRGSPVRASGRDGVLVTVRDATEEYQREQARQREDKLQSLGVLAGGIAHDFNNALTAIIGYITLARQNDERERREMLDGAERAAQNAARLTAQLLAFAKGGQPVRRSTDLARLLRDAVALAGAGSHMRVEFELDGDLWPARVDSGQFCQVVSNLVINATQATGEGGRLVVRATNVTGAVPEALVGSSRHAQDAVAEESRSVRIDFEDNGSGIPEAIRARVFDPYFTTRQGGNGLGLATAFAICRNHGGVLTFTSEEGVGTTFSAIFPATTEQPVTTMPPVAAAPDGHGHVLVLDDEPMVRTILSRLLTQLGFEVVGASDGQEAIDRYLERLREGRPFELLIMDLTIPGGMGGRQAMAEILRHDPQARAIVVSGYSADPTMANHREAGFLAALAKPFSRAELTQVVNEALTESRVATES